MSHHLICPHCHHHVPRGVHICRECHAEIEYGTPPTLILLVLMAATFVGIEVSALTALPWLGIVAAAGVIGGLCAWFARLFRNRVVFNRIYRML
ncbi:hypothetical protein [Paraburkholderia phosphatilytica]|uniref:hypothetical protein n=1 Tax=Paraburkholderia phosphatilytica TaxID=2282883 RepID=UPI000E477DE8|nr:hypothetical protein [Paraburkholderia phosphatilytica]